MKKERRKVREDLIKRLIDACAHAFVNGAALSDEALQIENFTRESVASSMLGMGMVMADVIDEYADEVGIDVAKERTLAISKLKDMELSLMRPGGSA